MKFMTWMVTAAFITVSLCTGIAYAANGDLIVDGTITTSGGYVHLYGNSNDSSGAIIDITKTRNGGPALSNDFLGRLGFRFINSISMNTQGPSIDSYLIDNTSGSEKGDLRFIVRDTGALYTAMSIKYNGNVGIGSDNPTPKLQVGATLNGNSGAFAGTVSIGPGMAGDSLNQDMMVIRSTTMDSSHFAFFVKNYGNQALFSIRDDGRVGIGTFSPTATLHVGGNIRIGLSSPQANKALCWTSTGTIGYCTSGIDSTGVCTCNEVR